MIFRVRVCTFVCSAHVRTCAYMCVQVCVCVCVRAWHLKHAALRGRLSRAALIFVIVHDECIKGLTCECVSV